MRKKDVRQASSGGESSLLQALRPDVSGADKPIRRVMRRLIAAGSGYYRWKRAEMAVEEEGKLRFVAGPPRF